MNTRKHVHQEVFAVLPSRLFEILHTPSAIRQWWGAARVIVLPEAGGIWAATWGDSEDEPDYNTAATISVFKPPERMVLCNYLYRAKTGPMPFKADFVTEFLVTEHPQGASLQVTQDGFPSGSEADEFYDSCETGWQQTFAGIRQFLEKD